MRVLNRDSSFFGFTSGFETYLRQISNYCFVTDMTTESREIYFRKNEHTYESAYLVDSKIKQALEKGVVTEETIIPLKPKFSLVNYFFYLDKGVSSQSLESLMPLGIKYLDFICKVYKNKFSDSIHEACVETEKELRKLKKDTEEISLERMTYEKYVRVVKELFLLYKNMIDSPLLCVRASVMLYSDDYADIKEYIFSNLNLVEKEKQNKIREIIEDNEVKINRSKVFPNRYYLIRQLEGGLKSYNYGELMRSMGKNDLPKELFHLIRYAYTLFTNPKDEPKWELDSKLIQQLNVRNILRAGFEKFSDFIDKENEYLDLKLILSKSQLYLMSRDYSNFVGTLQKFMENYLSILGANQTRIKEKYASGQPHLFSHPPPP